MNNLTKVMAMGGRKLSRAVALHWLFGNAERPAYNKEGLSAWIDAEYNTADGHSDTATTLTDMSGNGHDGVLHGSLIYADKGYTFTGDVANYISVATWSKLSIATALTVELCISVADLGATQRVLYADLFYENFIENGKLNIEELFGGARKRTEQTGTAGVKTIATTLNNETVNVYVNGERIGSYALDTISLTPADIYVGQGKGSFPLSAGSKFYSLRIYERALSDDEILQNYRMDSLRLKK